MLHVLRMAKHTQTAMLAASAAFVLGLLAAERARPLRGRTRASWPRTFGNFAMGAGCAAVIAAAEEPLTRRIARSNEANGRGFAQKLPRPLRLLGGIAAMDYGFYLWHVATHKVPFLWRFHRVHHVDPDLDASTAVRFNPLDMVISLPFRLAQVRLSGAGSDTLRYWRRFFTASILFHHSNLRLPDRWDRRLSLFLTTPKMHGIHHSNLRAIRDSNWTSGLSIWDRLHGTFRADIEQSALSIGVEDARAEQDIAATESLAAPFRKLPRQT
jgi:sterol desaturase/sphingolipid hydroxylase (fatty acid hydroxylase superfamily)